MPLEHPIISHAQLLVELMLAYRCVVQAQTWFCRLWYIRGRCHL